MHAFRHAIHTQFKGLVEAVTPASTVSQFEEKRLLTPEEFVAAGDHLVNTVGSWSWASCRGKAPVPFLPENKQYLVTRNVPCKKRATALQVVDELVQDADGEDNAWVYTAGNHVNSVQPPADVNSGTCCVGDEDDDV